MEGNPSTGLESADHHSSWDMRCSEADDRPNEETNRKSLLPADKTLHTRPTGGSISSYNTARLVWSLRRRSHSNSQKLPSSTTALSFEAPAKSNPREYPHAPYISRNYSHWPTFLSLIVWVCLHSNLCSGLQNTHLFCNTVRFGRSRSSKVDDFGTNRKRVCNFLIVHCDYGPILRRFWDTVTL